MSRPYVSSYRREWVTRVRKQRQPCNTSAVINQKLTERKHKVVLSCRKKERLTIKTLWFYRYHMMLSLRWLWSKIKNEKEKETMLNESCVYTAKVCPLHDPLSYLPLPYWAPSLWESTSITLWVTWLTYSCAVLQYQACIVCMRQQKKVIRRSVPSTHPKQPVLSCCGIGPTKSTTLTLVKFRYTS